MTSDYSLKRCGLKDQTVFLLESKKLRNAYDVLRLSAFDLVQVLDIPLDKAKEIMSTVSSRLVMKVERTTALHMKVAEQEDPRSVKTGVEALDEVLKGGLRAGTITEFVGPPGTRKSQLCLQVALFATLPKQLGGLDGKALYFDAENHFRVERLVQLAQVKFPDRYLALPLLNKMLHQILVSNVSTLSDLEGLLPNIERTVLEHDIRVIIIDNIAVLARMEYTGSSDIIARQKVLGKIASSLKKVACYYRIPIVIVNHGGNDYNAALGVKWAHYINTRIWCKRGLLHIVKSPFAPETTIKFPAGDDCISTSFFSNL